ncbi:MAG: pilin [Candidatus Paceibacterota bacterium]
MKKIILVLSVFALFASPVLVMADYEGAIGPNNEGLAQGSYVDQSTSKITDVNSLASKITGIFNLATYLLIALAVVYIVWNVVIYMIKPSEGDRTEAGKAILYGIIGLFIIVSIWGLVNILIGTFSTNNSVSNELLPRTDFVNNN